MNKLECLPIIASRLLVQNIIFGLTHSLCLPISFIKGDRMELRKSGNEEFYEWRTYHVKVDILFEADNCTGTKEYDLCMENEKKKSDEDSEPFSIIGCLPGWVIQNKMSYTKNASIWEMDYCQGAVENVPQSFKQDLFDALRNLLNFRQIHWSNCKEPCKHTFYTSTLATKIANRKA